jgi:TonB family protein
MTTKLFILSLLLVNIINTCRKIEPTLVTKTDGQKKSIIEMDDRQLEDLHTHLIRLYNEKKIDDAISLAQKEVELREQRSDPDKLKIVNALTLLGSLYFEKMQYEESESVYRKSLSILESTTDQDLTKTSEVIDRLAILADKRGDVVEAASFYKRLISIKGKMKNSNPIEMGKLMQKCVCTLLDGETANNKVETGNKEDAKSRYNKRYMEAIELQAQTDSLLKKQDDKSSALRVYRYGLLGVPVTYREAPLYPLEAKQKRVAGKVSVYLSVNEKGKVIEAQAICGPELLREASEKAALKWRFRPIIIDGTPVKIGGPISFRFSLDK